MWSLNFSRSVKCLFRASSHLTSASKITCLIPTPPWTMLAHRLMLVVGTSKDWTRCALCLVYPKVMCVNISECLELKRCSLAPFPGGWNSCLVNSFQKNIILFFVITGNSLDLAVLHTVHSLVILLFYSYYWLLCDPIVAADLLVFSLFPRFCITPLFCPLSGRYALTSFRAQGFKR